MLIGGISLWVANFFYQHHRFVITENAFQEAQIISVSTQDVSGKIVKLYKEEFDPVKKGEPLFKVDDGTYRKSVESLKASLKAMRKKREKLEEELSRLKLELPASYRASLSNLSSLKEKVKALREKVKLAEVEYRTTVNSLRAKVKASQEALEAALKALEKSKRSYERYKKLYEKRVISKEQFEEVEVAYYRSKAEYARAQSSLKASREELKRAESLNLKVKALKLELKGAESSLRASEEEVEVSRANLKRIRELKKAIEELRENIRAREKELQKAELLLKHTLVTSPVSGVVARKWKEVGEFVSPGLPVYSIYDPKSFYVLAWIDEDKVRWLKVGSKARARLETCKREFEGEVTAVGSSAGSVFALIPRDTSQGDYTRTTQRIPVKIRLNKVPKECIKPGSNVTVFIRKE